MESMLPMSDGRMAGMEKVRKYRQVNIDMECVHDEAKTADILINFRDEICKK
jgi:hypothetical protein